MRIVRALLIALAFVLILVLTFGGGYGLALASRGTAIGLSSQPIAQNIFSQDVPQRLQLLGEIWSVLQQDYVDPSALDGERLSMGAINGLIAALEDPHTTYIDAETYRLEQIDFQGSYEGIGVFFTIRQEFPVITSVIPNTPAHAAGLRAGDRIIAIDGQPAQGMTDRDVIRLVRGPRGTPVQLTILREGERQPFTVTILRGRIDTPTVLDVRMLEEGIGYLWITHITPLTPDQVTQAVRDLRNQGAQKLVLDLRNNPGGLLQETVRVADEFVVDGPILVQVDRSQREQVFRGRRGGSAEDLPLAVLINEASASGAEVIAGAIQDTNRGALIGQRTFGKGAVNHVRELSDGSALYVTIARWKTPNGRSIEGNGLSPDIEVVMTAEDRNLLRDPQLDAAVQHLRQLAPTTSAVTPSVEPSAVFSAEPALDPAFVSHLWLHDPLDLSSVL